MQTLLQNAQLLIVLAFVLLSLLGGIFRKVQEQREIQRRKAAADRARLEMLRTGRGGSGHEQGAAPIEQGYRPGPAPVGPPTSAAEALARLEEIARRRQEQMGKVRGQPQQQQQRRSSEPTGPVIVMGPSGPIVIRPGQGAGGGGGGGMLAGGMPQGRKSKQQRQPKQQGKQQQQARQQQAVTEPATPTHAFPTMEQARAAAAASAPAPQVARPAVLAMTMPQTPADWRRLAAGNAIFGRPVGEQGGGDGGPGRLF